MQGMWDVAVIGGGPAGMMAAGHLAARGARVILLEKNPILGKKLLITGGGRCNITNAEFDARALITKYGTAGKYLASPFATWGAKETIDFFEKRGMPIKVEAEKRAFPLSDRAQSVHDVLTAYMKEGGVTVRTSAPVKSLRKRQGEIVAALLKDGTEIQAHAFVLATGGKSRPETGSTGEGFVWLGRLGHTIRLSNAALVPISVHDTWVKRLAGVSLKDVKVTIIQGGEKQGSLVGKILFTHEGLSGPAILNLSRNIGELLHYTSVELELDLLPHLGYEKINEHLQKIFKTEHVKKLKNALREIIPSALVDPVLELSGVNGDIVCNSVTRADRIALTKLLKHVPISVKGLLGLDKAVVTSGGVSLDEIDTKTMRSRLLSNLYLIGDVLDIYRPSGGYSLQICWATAKAAADAALTDLSNTSRV